MGRLAGTRTEKNLLAAFAGESQALNRYTYFAKQAKKDGFVQISKVFEETAGHEQQHAKRLFQFLEGGEVEICAAFPAGVIGTTIDNLKASAAGENHEHTDMYPTFAKVARAEGFADIAAVFESIAVAEKYHESRFLKFAENIENDTVFKKSESVVWRCQNCGYNHEGDTALKTCPACLHPTAHFEIVDSNF
jgi:rubrerythrin